MMVAKTSFEKIVNNFARLLRDTDVATLDDSILSESLLGKPDPSRMITHSLTNDRYISMDKRKYRTLAKQIHDVYPGQLSDKLIHDGVLEIAIQLNEASPKGVNPASVTPLVADFIQHLEQEIRDLVVLVLVDGLDMNIKEPVALGPAVLIPYTPASDYAKAVQWEQDLRERDTVKYPCLRFEGLGHIDRVVETAITSATTSLDIFRLYRASWFRDQLPAGATQKRIGLRIPSAREITKVYVLNADLSVFQVAMFPQHFDSYPFDDYHLNRMKRLGLEVINGMFADPDASQGDKALRVRRAIHWFAKGTHADSLADSFLMYAIAVEALLSQGRNSQEGYSNRVAGLIARDITFWGAMEVSRKFASRVVSHEPSALFQAIAERTRELFEFRNRIAHGHETTGDMDEDDKLIDFESITRCAILSFAMGPWASLNDYVAWLNDSLTIRFLPRADLQRHLPLHQGQ